MIIRNLYYVNHSQNTEICLFEGMMLYLTPFTFGLSRNTVFRWPFVSNGMMSDCATTTTHKVIRILKKPTQLSSQNTQKVLLCHRKRKVQLQWGYRVVFCSRDARILFTFDLLLSVYLTLLGRSERELQCISQVFSFCARSPEIPDTDWSNQGLDAWHVLSQWKGGS